MITDPVKASIEWLVDCGWEQEQAENLCAAIHAETPEKLWEVAPKWIEHCGEAMKYVRDMLGVVASGYVEVTLADDGQWMFKLKETWMEIGQALHEREIARRLSGQEG